MIDPQLNGRVAIVTGANHGIGAVTDRALAAQGANVFITYHLLDSPYSDEELDEALHAGVGGDRLCMALQGQPGEVVDGSSTSQRFCDMPAM